DGKTESPRPSQKFMRRIIQFVLRIIEGVNMEIELDPIASFLVTSRARAHGGGRFGLRHPELQARFNNPMTERELRQDDHEWEKKNRGSNTELGTVNSARGAA